MTYIDLVAEDTIDTKIQNISEELKKKYGDVVINTQTGEIIKEE